jgi:LysR family transcriptional regulator, regulator for metE and metH
LLEVRDLQLVLALAGTGSTASASDPLHLSQPAVSRALLALEGKLGTALFERVARGLTPTAAGERLISGARELLLGLQDLEQRTRSPQPASRLRVVCECYTAYHWLPSALDALHRTAPDLEVSIEVAHTSAPAAALANGDVDVALLTTARLPRGALAERALFSDEVVFVLAQRHPLAAKKTLARADLRAYPLLTSSNTPAAEARWFARAAFGRQKPRVTFRRLPLTEAILDVARAGMGIAVLSEWIAGPHLARGDLIARRLSTGPLRRPWRFAYRRDLAEPAQRLFALLQSAAPRLRLVS